MPNVIETADAAAGASTLYSLGIGQSAQGSLSSLGDSDWYAVNLVAGQQYTVAMVREGALGNGLGDSYLSIRNAGGTTLWQDDDSGPGSSSTVTFTATSSGTYYIDAQAYGGSDTGRYGVSITAGATASYDADMAAGVLLRQESSWSATAGTGVNVTWSVSSSDSAQTDASNVSTAFIAPSAAQISVVSACLAQFAAVCNVSFTRVNPGGTSNQATIRVNAYDSTTDGSGAYAYFPGSTAGSSAAGDINLNNDSISRTSIPQGSYSYFAILHEIGHAMGLAHPGDYNAAAGVDITYDNSAQYKQDSHQYTVMSYFDESETHANYKSYPDGLLLHDIYALQQLYGADMTTRKGNSVYGFHSNTGGIYDFSHNVDPVFSIWDAGGTDTIDASGFSQVQRISLVEGTFSSIGGLTNNISIAFGAVVENAVGGSGNDTITGNDRNNVLDGGAGKDKLIGGAGNDTYVLGSSTDTVSDTSGIDTITTTVSRSLVSYKAIEKLTLLGSKAINGTGNSLDNTLLGNAAANVLKGGAGDDRLIGGGGNDTLVGGLGSDTFVFKSALNSKTNVDKITDFSVIRDTIELENAIFKAFKDVGEISAVDFARNYSGKATDINDHLIYNVKTGDLYYDSNGSKAGGSVLFAQLEAQLDLSYRDFLIA